MIQTISDLLSDIRAYENMIRYYENKILRKKIAIQELMDTQQVKDETTIAIKKAKALDVTHKNTRTRATPRVRELFLNILPTLEEPFGRAQVKKALIKAFPNEEFIIRKCTHNAITIEESKGIIKKIGFNKYRKAFEEERNNHVFTTQLSHPR